ncbi:MAG: hypothetical protein KDM64_18800, partial [Verrucomicrobiae bacterium]|nr:hypothetical protein [Verrucomicrobiae bacterium]
ATFQMQVDKDIDSHAFSLGNTFRKCERHSLYVFSGGPFLSEGDTFYDGSDGRHGWPARLKWEDAVAAIALKGGTGGKVETQTDAFQGGSHMRISNAYFENCRDCINLSRATPEYPPGVTIQKFFDVSITDCKFVDTLRRDILLNNGDPDVTGLWANIVVERTKHINQSGAYPFETGVPIQLVVASFQDMVLRDIELHIREGGDYSIITTLNCMLIYGRGSSSEFASNNLVIERVIGNCEPVSESNITAQRVIQVHNSVYKPGETDDVIIRDVTAPAGVTPVNPTSGSNTHYKVNVNPYNL